MYQALKPYLCKDLINLCCPLVYDEPSAAKAGDLEALKYLYKLHWLHGESPRPYSTLKVALGAIEGRHLRILKWLKMDLLGMPLDDVTQLMTYVATNVGHLKWIRFLDQTLNFDVEIGGLLAENGHLDSLRYLYAENKLSNLNEILTIAARCGEHKIVKWATSIRNLRALNKLVAVRDTTAYLGFISLVKWFWYNLNLGCTMRTLQKAIIRGHLELAQWICATFQLRPDSSTYCWALAGGHLDVIRWIKLINPKVSLRDSPDEAHLVNLVAGQGTDALEWLHVNDPASLNYLDGSIYNRAAQEGRLDVMKWLKANCSHIRPLCAHHDAQVRGDHPMLQWLHKHFPEGDIEEWRIDESLIEQHRDTFDQFAWSNDLYYCI